MYTKLISVETKARFDTIQAGRNPFPNQSFVIIEDTQQIWTHGIFFNGITVTTGVGTELTATIAGQNYALALSDYYHKKNTDLDLGLYTDNNYTLSYKLKAGVHELIQYMYKGNTNSQTGIHIGTEDDKILINSKSSIVRQYHSGTALASATILDTSNIKYSISNNTLTYNFGAATDSTMYLVRQDIGLAAPSTIQNNQYSRIGGNDSLGWIVANKNGAGSNTYYYLTFSNETEPKVKLKVPIVNNEVAVMTINDTFVGATSSQAGSAGIVPAPPANAGLFLRSNGTWDVPVPDISIASASAAGLIKAVAHAETVTYHDITATEGRFFQLEVDSDGKGFVNVPGGEAALVLGKTANSTTNISSNQSDPYINLIVSGVLQNAIQLKAGTLTTITGSSSKVVTIGNSTQTWKINNTSYNVCTDTALSNIFAPTTAGTSGQILQAAGNNSAPTWINISDLATSIINNDSSSVEFTKAITTDWQDTGISTTSTTVLGTYAIQVKNNSNDIWSGIFSWGEVVSSSTVNEEVLLHSLNTSDADIFIKVVSASGTTHSKLQIAATQSISSTKYTITLRRLC